MLSTTKKDIHSNISKSIETGLHSLTLQVSTIESAAKPALQENTWEIEVPNDNSCLFWAAILAYLLPVLEDDALFHARFIKAFGEREADKIDAIRLLLKSYNPFGNTDIFKNLELKQLIREQFRRRTIEYVADRAEMFRDFWDNGNNRLESTFEDYLSRMHDVNSWGGELEIRAMSLMLSCGIKVFSSGNQSHYSIDAAIQIELTHVNANQEASKGGNHYRFRIDKRLGDAYQKESAEVNKLSSLREGVAPLLSLLHETITEPTEKIEASYFFNKYQCIELEEALFKSTQARNLQDVQGLLILGAKIDAQLTNQERTALHQAVLNKDEKITVILLLYGAKSNIPDKELVTAETYAENEQFPLQVLRKRALNEAAFRKDYQRQCNLLIDLGQKALQDQNYAESAMLFMGSLAIVQNNLIAFKEPQLIEKTILLKAKEIEGNLIKHVSKSGLYHPVSQEAYGINSGHKEFLKKIRSEVIERAKQFTGLVSLPDPETTMQIEELFRFISTSICQFLSNIIEDSIRLLQGNPPCGYAFIGTGSLARGEMTPYSDVEYFILIEEDTPKNREYFYHLSQIFQVKIIMLGETDLNKGHGLLPPAMQNPTKKGFSLDVQKNPAKAKNSLIGTPIEMAKYQHPDHYVQEPNNHFSGAFINLVLISGNREELLHELKEGIQKIYATTDGSDKESTLRVKRTLSMLSEDVNHFEPKTGLTTEGQLFDAKFDFYRLPQTIIDALSVYKNLQSSSTWGRIRELFSEGFFCEAGATQLLQLLSFSAWLRLRTYSYYASQQESLDVFFMLKNNEGENRELHYGLSEEDLAILTEMYKILIPLHKSAKTFYQDNALTENVFCKEFYDNSSLMLAKIASRLCQYKKALSLYKETLKEAEKKKDIQTVLKVYNRLSDIATKLGLNEEANHYLKSCLSLYSTYDKGASFNIAKVLIALANNGSIKEGFDYLKKALIILDRLSNSEDLEVASARHDIGSALLRLGKIKEATHCFIQARDLEIRLKGSDYLGLIYVHSSLGAAYQDQSQDDLALASYEEALRIVRKTYGLKHPLAALIFLNIGTLFQQRERYKQALKYYQSALEINISLFGPTHPDVIKIYNNLGTLWLDQNRHDYAKACFEEAMRLHSMSQDQDEVNLACDQNNLGSLYHASGEYRKAEEAWQRAIGILKNANITDHYKFATALNNLAMAMYGGEKVEEAKKYLDEALSIVESKFGKGTPESVTILYNQGLVFIKLKQYQKALNCFSTALHNLVSVYGHGHPKEITILKSSAKLTHFMGGFMANVDDGGDRPSAVKVYHKLLDLMADHHGEDSPVFINALLEYDRITLLHTYVRIAKLYLELGALDKSKQFLDLALDLSLVLHGRCHPDTALVLFEMGIYYRCAQQEEKAEDYFKTLFYMVKDVFDINHPITHYIFCNLKVDIDDNKFHFQLKEMPKQIANQEDEMKLMGELEGLIKKEKKIAKNYYDLDKFDAARLCLEQALSYTHEIYGEGSIESIDIYLYLGSACHAMQDFEKAQEYLNFSLNLATSLLEENDPMFSSILKAIEQVASRKVESSIIDQQEAPILSNREPRPLIFSQFINTSVMESKQPSDRLRYQP